MSNSDPTSFVLNHSKTTFASGMEQDHSDLLQSIRHQEIFEPQPRNFGSMDCALGDFMLGMLNSGACGLGLRPSQGHCVVFLGKTLYSYSASLHPGV